MVTKEQMIKGLDSLESLIKEQVNLGRDALIFVFEKGLWEEFMGFHIKKYIDRVKTK